MPVLLIAVLALLLYVPPVQNWAVKQAARIASEQTGLTVTVGHVSLKWPLDLALDDFIAIHEKDTLLSFRQLTVDVRLRPLLDKKVVVDEFVINEAKLNTNGYLSDLQVTGEFENLKAQSRSIDLRRHTVDLDDAQLSGGRFHILLSDTAQADTVETEIPWFINIGSAAIAETGITLRLPNDTTNIYAYAHNLTATKGTVDLSKGYYAFESFLWEEGKLDQLSFHTLQLDSVEVDTTAIRLPHLLLKTPDSDVTAEAVCDWNVVDSLHPGNLHLRLNAQIGKQDILHINSSPLLGKSMIPQKFIEHYPNHPLQVIGSADGNLKHLQFTGLDVSLPTAFHLWADGEASNLTSLDSLKSRVNLRVQTQNLNFLTSLLPPKTMQGYRIPTGMEAQGLFQSDANRYDADFILREGKGTVKGKGTFDAATMAYEADIKVDRLNLHHFMPHDSIYQLSATARLKGNGTELLKSSARMDADIAVTQLQYGQWNIQNVSTKGTIRNGRAQLSFNSNSPLLEGTARIDALLNTKMLQATVSADIHKADLYRLRISGNDELTVGFCGHIDVNSDMKQSHYVSGLIGDLYLTDAEKTYRPEDIGLHLKTNRDTTLIRAQSGDLIVKIDGSGGYERILSQLSDLSDAISTQFANRVIDQPRIKALLPTLRVYAECRSDNPLANLLHTKEISFQEAFVNMTLSPLTGVNGQAHLRQLVYDSIRIDTINLHLTQKGERLSYQAQVTNNRKNPQFVFNALLDGHFTEHGALAGLRYFDDQGHMGIRLGASASMEPDGLRFHLMPERPTIGYKVFQLNKDNYIFLGRDRQLTAKVDLIADDGTGIKLYTTESQDSTLLQDLTVSVNRFNLEELTSVIPYMPRVSGLMNGDFHIVLDEKERISVVSDLAIQKMYYEGSPIGNLCTELVYLQREDEGHAIEARLMLDDEEFGLLSGSYWNRKQTPAGRLDATFTMTRLPLSIVNGFVPDQLVGLDGYAEGTLTIKGTTEKPIVDGEVLLDSAYLVSLPYNIRMRFDNDPVRIVGSHLLIENFGLYAYNDEPLNMMGDIDFSDLDHISIDMRMRATNLLLINARQTPKSLAFGKAYVNFYSRLQGPIEALRMRGRLDVLGSTDLTYMLLDSPLSTDNRMDELVKFTDFSDTTQTVVTRPVPKGLDADLTVSVSRGAHIVCNLNDEQTNYLDLMGGGDLRMRYNQEGLSLTGRYTLNNGLMKYSLPIIPLKTFTIQEGSYVEFTGDPMNPRLNITATERTRATVSDQNGQSRPVSFDCGVIITKTLSDMGLQFIISAPEDMTISSELQSMSTEERGKLAVTMLTTGMYLADGNTNGFSMNAALSSFLQGEINQITGSALKTLDVQVGLDNTTDASGQMHTDYSFRFSKRLWNNRLSIQLGGKVSTGSNDAMGQQQSFFDNVTMEYRLDQSAQKNIRLFYKQNVYDWLEGYTGEYGAGFVWRRKMDSLKEIFSFFKKEEPLQPIPIRRDSLRTNTLRTVSP